MCWDYQSSVNGFLFAWTMSIAAQFIPYTTDARAATNKWLATLLMVVTLVQFGESCLWFNFTHDNSPMLTNWYTRLTGVLLWMQPLANVACLMLFSNVANFSLIQCYCLCITAISLYQIWKATLSPSAKNWTTFKGSNCHLVWTTVNHSQDNNRREKDNEFVSLFTTFSSKAYLIGVCFPLLYLPQLRILTFLAVGGTYKLASTTSTRGEVSSHWCYIIAAATVVPFIAYLAETYTNVPEWLFY